LVTDLNIGRPQGRAAVHVRRSAAAIAATDSNVSVSSRFMAYSIATVAIACRMKRLLPSTPQCSIELDHTDKFGIANLRQR
jgi:hypothetical protein